MIQIALLLMALTITSVYSLVQPVLMSDDMVNTIIEFLSSIWYLTDLLPIEAFIDILKFDVYLFAGILIFRLIFGFLAGKPEIQ